MNYKRFEDLPCWNKAREFLGYSQRSCGEVQSQLYRALDCGYISQSQFDEAYEIASECRKQIKGFRKYLRDYDSKE